ncbi:uncharacterized protein [Leuresthes tenuis]|uniref:uncharacterized protein isoform X1 n=1 Tax=Leuresthes tenuis TaxID=355514 RepID=UPI003B504D96
MRLSLSASIFLLFLRPLYVSLSTLPEDLEASGYDLDISGSGLGDGSELVSPGETKNIKNELNNKDGGVFTPDSEEGNKNTLQGSSDLTFDRTYWHPRYDASELVLLSNGKRFLSHQEIHAGALQHYCRGSNWSDSWSCTVSNIDLHTEEERQGKMPEKFDERRLSQNQQERSFCLIVTSRLILKIHTDGPHSAPRELPLNYSFPRFSGGGEVIFSLH